MTKDTIKTATYFLILAVGISLVTYGTQNGIDHYAQIGIGLVLLQAVLGLVDSVRDIATRDAEAAKSALNELNSAQGRKFMTVLTVSLISLLTLWGVAYSIVFVNIESLVTMVIVAFTGMVVGSLVVGIPLVWYTFRILPRSEN